MIYLCTALPFEAQPFIDRFQLKSEKSSHSYTVYNNEEICLIITGTNPFHAAISLTNLLSSKVIQSNDLLINIGVCGAVSPSTQIGEAFLINKIRDHSTEMTFYPDILYKHPFGEASIETFPKVVQKSQNTVYSEDLVDMESSGIYMAASHFCKCNQILFIKIVSDHMNSNSITPKDIIDFIAPYTETVIDFGKHISSTILDPNKVFTKKQETQILELSSLLHLSKTMEFQLKQLFIYGQAKGTSISNILDEFLNNEQIKEIKIKKEGKKYFELLQERLTQ